MWVKHSNEVKIKMTLNRDIDNCKILLLGFCPRQTTRLLVSSFEKQNGNIIESTNNKPDLNR